MIRCLRCGVAACWCDNRQPQHEHPIPDGACSLGLGVVVPCAAVHLPHPAGLKAPPSGVRAPRTPHRPMAVPRGHHDPALHAQFMLHQLLCPAQLTFSCRSQWPYADRCSLCPAAAPRRAGAGAGVVPRRPFPTFFPTFIPIGCSWSVALFIVLLAILAGREGALQEKERGEKKESFHDVHVTLKTVSGFLKPPYKLSLVTKLPGGPPSRWRSRS